MKKTFTYKIPNEIWVDDFSDNLTSSEIYEGPETIYVLVENNSIIDWNDSGSFKDYREHNQTIITLDANTSPDIAYMITNRPEPREFEDEINSDGSVYQKIKNPQMSDYYKLYYDNYNNDNPWYLVHIVKKTLSTEELNVKGDLEIAENFKKIGSFDSNTTVILDNYINSAKDYLDYMKTYYPWKYIEINIPETPEMPEVIRNYVPNS